MLPARTFSMKKLCKKLIVRSLSIGFRKKKKVLVLMGPPGSGKTTLSNMLSEEINWSKFSAGKICKNLNISESGELVADEFICLELKNWLNENFSSSSGIIIDGFPRTVKQAKSLNSLLGDNLGHSDLKVVSLKYDPETIIYQTSNRYVCSNKECSKVYLLTDCSSLVPKKGMICDRCSSTLVRRRDDEPEIVEKRLKAYHGYEKKLTSFYKNEHLDFVAFKLDFDDSALSLDEQFEKFKELIGIN